MDLKNSVSYQSRLQTFSSWKNQQFCKQLAENGFFLTAQKDDFTQCAYCNIQIRKWHGNENVKSVHFSLNKFCPLYLREMYSDYNMRLRTFRYWPSNSVVGAVDLTDAGFLYLGINDRVRCYACLLILEDWKSVDVPQEIHRKISPLCPAVISSTSMSRKPSAPPREPHNPCVICVEKEKEVCFLPCSHVICCLTCAGKIQDICPLCNNKIKIKQRIFL